MIRWAERSGVAPGWFVLLGVFAMLGGWAGDQLRQMFPAMISGGALYPIAFALGLVVTVLTLLVTSLHAVTDQKGLTGLEGRRLSTIQDQKIRLFTYAIAVQFVVTIALVLIGMSMDHISLVKGIAGMAVGAIGCFSFIVLLYALHQFRLLSQFTSQVRQRQREQERREQAIADFQAANNGRNAQ